MNHLIKLAGFGLGILLTGQLYASAACPSLPHLGQETESICETEGKKYSIFEFSSVSCGYCRANIPRYQQLSAETADVAKARYIFLEGADQVQPFVKEHKITLPVAIDDDEHVADTYEVNQIPAMFILDENKKVIYSHAGVLSQQDIRHIKELLKK